MRSRFLTKGLTALAAVAALGLASRASANEPAVYTGVDTTYVNADSLRVKNIREGNNPDKSLNSQAANLHESNSTWQKIARYLPDQLNLNYGFGGSEEPVHTDAPIEFGLDARLGKPSLFPLWLTSQISGGKARGLDEPYSYYNDRSMIYRVGLEARPSLADLGIFAGFSPFIELTAELGYDVTTSTTDELDRPNSPFGSLGYRFNFDPENNNPPNWYPTSVAMKVGKSSKGAEAHAIWSFKIGKN